MYFDKKLHRGYNAYIDAARDDLGTMMDVGLLVMEPGDTYAICDGEKETAVLLFEGAVELSYGEKVVPMERPDCFRYEAYCLLAPRGTKIGLIARSHAELYIQQTPNDRDYKPVLYTPETVQVQHAGANGELMGAMRREIKTFFDYENAPFSNMVLGEVLNFYRFDYPQGFGAGFANGEIYETHHNGLAVINSGFHSQCAAPGYAMCYAWGIRHLDGDPWQKTRIDDPEHSWLWKPDANDHIFKG